MAKFSGQKILSFIKTHIYYLAGFLSFVILVLYRELFSLNAFFSIPFILFGSYIIAIFLVWIILATAMYVSKEGMSDFYDQSKIDKLTAWIALIIAYILYLFFDIL